MVITKYITINDEDYETLVKLHELNVKFDVRLQPGDADFSNFYELMLQKKG